MLTPWTDYLLDVLRVSVLIGLAWSVLAFAVAAIVGRIAREDDDELTCVCGEPLHHYDEPGRWQR